MLDALAKAARDLFSLRVLWIVIWPVLVAAGLWLALAFGFWSTFAAWIAQAFAAIGIDAWLAELDSVWLAHAVQLIVYLAVFVPLVMLTALVITALFAMPALVRAVAARDYPALERKRGGGFFGSLGNALVALAGFAALWAVTLPLWFIGIGVIVPFVAAAWLNQRLFRYDAVADHASAAEMATLFTRERASWWGLGLTTGLVQFVPIVNLLAPVYAALAFIHFGLARLDVARGRDVSAAPRSAA